MKNKIKYSLAFLALTSLSMAAAAGATGAFTFSNAAEGAMEGIGSRIQTLVKFIFWVMYIVGGCLIGMAGFKLKEGDLKGFVKTLIGGSCVFISPFLIEALLKIANGST